MLDKLVVVDLDGTLLNNKHTISKRNYKVITELQKKGVSKAKGIDYIMDQYDLKREEIISIGNNFNDISMLDNSGLAVAMGNSPEAVKKRADLITTSNEEDGVAAILEEIFAEILI
jgi:hydroxymethylpyrimidine pyrophosphatase-like HAD family hydrolase